MKILTLQIKKPYLDAILSGEKTEEYREVRPKNVEKYLIGNIEANSNEPIDIVQYDAIRFFNGYATNRPEVLIEIKETFIDFIVDENEEDIIYEEDGVEYLTVQMTYVLGKVIERKNI